MEEALAGLARGNAANPLRSMLLMPFETPVPSVLASMPAALGDPPALGIKVISVFPGNHGTGYDSHQGSVLLFEPEHGSPVALIDAIAVTAIRTAAVSGLATRLLRTSRRGRPGHHRLRRPGAVPPGRRARRPTRSGESASGARTASASTHSSPMPRSAGVTVEASADAHAAVAGADIVCTVTSSSQPVVEGAWLAPTAPTSTRWARRRPANRELDSDAVAALPPLRRPARVGAATRRATYLIPLREGAIGEDHIMGEIGEVLRAWREGRRSADEITLFKSLGLAIEDLAAARWIHHRALETGAGTPVPLGGGARGAAAGGHAWTRFAPRPSASRGEASDALCPARRRWRRRDLLKLENLQPIGSFKVRGALNSRGCPAPAQLARALTRRAPATWRARGLVGAATSAFRATVIVPDPAPAAKLEPLSRARRGGDAGAVRSTGGRCWRSGGTRTWPARSCILGLAPDDRRGTGRSAWSWSRTSRRSTPSWCHSGAAASPAASPAR